MLAIERVRATALTLLGLGTAGIGTSGAGSEQAEIPSNPVDEAEDRPSPSGPFSPGAPVFEAVETALKKAGYLDS